MEETARLLVNMNWSKEISQLEIVFRILKTTQNGDLSIECYTRGMKNLINFRVIK